MDAVTRSELRCAIDGFEAPPTSAVSWCSALLVSRGADDECTIDECENLVSFLTQKYKIFG